MTTGAFLLVLASACIHAIWNYIAKQSEHKAAFLWCTFTLSFALYLPPAIVFALRDGIEPWSFLFAPGVAILHGSYGLALARGYQVGDLSAVYPVGRGIGPMLIPIFAVLFLGENVSAMAAAGIALVIVGIYAIHAEQLSLAALLRPLRLLGRIETRYAVIIGSLLAAYSLLDKVALDYIPAPTLLQCATAGHLFILMPLALRNGAAPARSEWRQRKRGIIFAAVTAPLGFLLVLIALTMSRVSYVGPVREVGIIFGTALGVFSLREPYGLARIPGAALIASGVVLLGLAP
ncbi:MAG: EamA family transporter [Dehalococcoidia bacterium]